MQSKLSIFGILFCCLLAISCRQKNSPSVLLIAVDNLAVSDIPCSNQENTGTKSGFHHLCQDSVRFTHAFTPSPLAAPAMASILTGLYPFENQVRHNGTPGLTANFTSIAEVAVQKNYRTAFFSGGAPLLRKTGLHQGFELFEDNFTPSPGLLFRPAKKNIELLLSWLDGLDDEPFLSVLYLPDLQYTNSETTSDLGELRSLSFESQLEEIDEKLADLFSYLKSNNLWDSTHIVLVGLNGHNLNDRAGEISGQNLHSENTQIALLIKTAQKKRDQGLSWKIDKNVTLVDLGKTLFSFLNSPLPKSNPRYPTFDLTPLLTKSEPQWNDERGILLESAWGQWQGLSNNRAAVIRDQFLYIHDKNPRLYNTLLDRMESTPINMTEQATFKLDAEKQALTSLGYSPWIGLPQNWLAKMAIPYPLWTLSSREDELLNLLSDLSSEFRDTDLYNWTAQIALNRKNGNILQKIGLKTNNIDLQITADKLNGDTKTKKNSKCFDLARTKSLDNNLLWDCDESMFLELIDWIRASERGLDKEAQRKKFSRTFTAYLIDQEIQKTNIALGYIWDVPQKDIFAPTKTELFLAWPENQKLRQEISRETRWYDWID